MYSCPCCLAVCARHQHCVAAAAGKPRHLARRTHAAAACASAVAELLARLLNRIALICPLLAACSAARVTVLAWRVIEIAAREALGTQASLAGAESEAEEDCAAVRGVRQRCPVSGQAVVPRQSSKVTAVDLVREPEQRLRRLSRIATAAAPHACSGIDRRRDPVQLQQWCVCLAWGSGEPVLVCSSCSAPALHGWEDCCSASRGRTCDAESSDSTGVVVHSCLSIRVRVRVRAVLGGLRPWRAEAEREGAWHERQSAWARGRHNSGEATTATHTARCASPRHVEKATSDRRDLARR